MSNQTIDGEIVRDESLPLDRVERIATGTVLGNVSGISASPSALIAAQLLQLLGLRFQVDSFAVSGLGPYNLSQTQSGRLFVLLLDGSFQKPADYSTTSTTFTLGGGYDPSFYQNALALYTY